MSNKLQLGQSIDDLDKMIALPDLRLKPTSIVVQSALKVLQEAQKYTEACDDERAYIFLMKYFGLTDMLQKRSDFHKEKKKFSEASGGCAEVMKLFDRLDKIKDRLIRRYDELNKSKKSENRQNAIEPDENESNDVKMKEAIIQRLSIECNELFRLLQNQNANALIIDCRKSDDFNATKLSSDKTFNVPEQHIRKGLSADKLSDYLNSEDRKMWNKRKTSDQVVLIDWNSTDKVVQSTIPIWTLRDILINWDPDVTYPNSIQILNGGFEQFQIMYPMCTTNPRYKPPQAFIERDLVNEIEYPSMDDIKMKDNSLKDSPKPRIFVDRSNKPTALKTMQEKSRIADEMIKAKAELIDKALKNELKARKIMTDLDETISEAPPPTNSVELEQWHNKTEELEYKLMQYENSQTDTKTQKDEIEEELESVQPDVNDPNISLKQQKIKEMENEQIKLENERRIWHERHDQRARELKRQIKFRDEDVPIRPKQPIIDRSNKPLGPFNQQQQIISRNFSAETGPVQPGLTGLQNLGNTCYMNSIIQCLSNLELPSEYLRSGHYRKHLNRKSKTRGQITDEFAAVIVELWNGKYKSIAPRDFRYVFGQYQKMFSGYEQQDSHEFLTILMDNLHLELELTLDESIPEDKLNASDRAWRSFVNNKQSRIMDLFYGQIRSTVKCRTCQHESATYEGFSNLSFELPQNSKQCDLKECMDMYFDGEIVDGWHCPKCNLKREAVKKLDISRVPPYLVIHFKRFYADLETSLGTYKKKQNYVRFPITKFNINDYLTRSVKKMNPPPDFNLCAVSNHYGTIERGHYTAFCRNYNYRTWYKFDDSYVSRIDDSDVVSSAAYILFFSCL